MNTRLFNKIAQGIKNQFPKASQEFQAEQTRQMYEAEMQRRAALSPHERSMAEARDIVDDAFRGE